MSQPAAVTCGLCHTPRVYRRVATGLPGTVPVEIGFCDCDFPQCRRDGCGKAMRNEPDHGVSCPRCKGRTAA